jgi:hypothetical protein
MVKVAVTNTSILPMSFIIQIPSSSNNMTLATFYYLGFDQYLCQLVFSRNLGSTHHLRLPDHSMLEDRAIERMPPAAK